jgi:hypothetical protein
MRPLKPTLAIVVAAAATLSVAACSADVEVGGDDIADATISADGHTYEVTDLHIEGNSATAETEGGRTLTFRKVGTGWTLTK